MSGKSLIQSMLLTLAILFSASAFAAEDASMHQIYEAAEAGRMDEAQSMIQKVLQDHPKSAKAHFVEAELFSKQGRFASAQAELATANQLAPGLPFAKPAAVENLRNRITHVAPQSAVVRQSTQAYPAQAPASSGISGSFLLVVLALVAFIVFAVKFMGRRTAPVYTQNGIPGFGAGAPVQSYGSGMPVPSYGPGAGGPMMGGQAAGGMGSGILGGLATGAAMGAGLVAGEALMHHFTDGERGSRSNEQFSNRDDYIPAPAVPNDMGGTDFGIVDNSSWDDGGGSGGGDWDS